MYTYDIEADTFRSIFPVKGQAAVNIYAMAGHAIRRLNQRAGQVFAAHMDRAGLDLTSVQFAAMDAIRANPGIDQASVASKIAYDRATIGGVIDRLEQKGWVSRKVSKRDRRAREVRLTDEGMRIHRQALPLVEALQPEILEALSDDEQAIFIELARKAAGSFATE